MSLHLTLFLLSLFFLPNKEKKCNKVIGNGESLSTNTCNVISSKTLKVNTIHFRIPLKGHQRLNDLGVCTLF